MLNNCLNKKSNYFLPSAVLLMLIQNDGVFLLSNYFSNFLFGSAIFK